MEAGLKLAPSDREDLRDVADLHAVLKRYDQATQLYSIQIP
jgi:hypothetical protein